MCFLLIFIYITFFKVNQSNLNDTYKPNRGAHSSENLFQNKSKMKTCFLFFFLGRIAVVLYSTSYSMCIRTSLAWVVFTF